jgi:adenylate cyclase
MNGEIVAALVRWVGSREVATLRLGRMERSAEIEAVFRRLMDTLSAGDEAAAHNLIAKKTHVRMILTGEDEWWEGHDEVTGLLLVRFREAGIVRFEFDRLEGFESGAVGVVAARVVNHVATRDQFPLRHSVVFVLEAGTWRMAHWHVSNPTPNVEVFGHEMSKSLSDLVSYVREEPDELVHASGTVTVMFTDLVDSTVVTGQVGDRQWAQLVSEHFGMVRQIVERFDGTMVKTLGDGTMSAFGSATAALEAAGEIQRAMTDSSLKVRIGIHSGDSQRKEGDYYGVSVNKAARIGSIGHGGEVNASSVTAELAAGHGLSFGPPRSVSLKGLDGTHVVVPFDWESLNPAIAD